MPSLICPIFRKKSHSHHHKKKHHRTGHAHDDKGTAGSVSSTDVLGDYSPGSTLGREASPRSRAAPTKHLPSGRHSSKPMTSHHVHTRHVPLSLQNNARFNSRDDDSSLPTIDPDYNPTSDNFSLSDAGGTIGSQSLSTTIFGSQRPTYGSANSAINSLERGLYTTNSPYQYNNEHYYQKQTRGGGGLQSQSSKPQTLEIYAPSGKLGVVIDVPLNSTTPVVHAIKDSCPIRNEIQVGDQLLAVDEEDVRNMSAVEVSRLISRKSGEEVRKLTVLRSGRNNGVW